MQPLIQALLTFLIPTIGTMLPGILKEDHYAPWLNGLIAGLIVVLAALAKAYVDNKLGFNFWLDAGVTITAISSLLAGPLKGLDAYMTSYVSLLPKPQTVDVQQAMYPATIQRNAPGPDTSTHEKAL